MQQRDQHWPGLRPGPVTPGSLIPGLLAFCSLSGPGFEEHLLARSCKSPPPMYWPGSRGLVCIYKNVRAAASMNNRMSPCANMLIRTPSCHDPHAQGHAAFSSWKAPKLLQTPIFACAGHETREVQKFRSQQMSAGSPVHGWNPTAG